MGAKDIFAERLAALRNNKGVSRQAVADTLGISRASLEYYEKGQRVPDITVLEKIADYFHVSADYLLGRSDVASVDPSQKFQAACEVTGLSDEAIQYLRNLHETRGREANNVISELITYPLFHFALIDILRAVDYCKADISEKNLSNTEKEVVNKSIELLEEHGYELREPSDIAFSHAMQAYEAFKYIIDDVISSLSGSSGFVLRHNDMAFDLFSDMYGKKAGD